MGRKSLLDLCIGEVDKVLDTVAHLDAITLELVLKACLKRSRECRYFRRKLPYPEEWRPVLRTGYDQYVVSNWGFYRHKNKNKTDANKLRPAFEHDYARAALKAAHRSNGATHHMIHELVIESFVLGEALPDQCRDQKNMEVINHLDGDKYNPALGNLEITDQGKNMLHAYSAGLRKPRN